MDVLGRHDPCVRVSQIPDQIFGIEDPGEKGVPGRAWPVATLRARVRSNPVTGVGAIAQLGERLLCKQEVVGSIPSGSTSREAPSSVIYRFASPQGHRPSGDAAV